MKQLSFTKTLKRSILISIVFIALIKMRPIWERYPGGYWNILFYLAIGILFLWISAKILSEFIQTIKRRKHFKFNSLTPIGILLIGMFAGIFNPLKVNFDSIYGNVNFRACFEGTQNQATFKLRDNERFDIHWTGAFMYDEFFTGSYKRIGDTLLLTYDNKKPIRFGEKILMDNEKQTLNTIRSEDDSLQYLVPFYYGYCKGLN